MQAQWSHSLSRGLKLMFGSGGSVPSVLVVSSQMAKFVIVPCLYVFASVQAVSPESCHMTGHVNALTYTQ